jgi:hypothetical protein
MLCIQVTAKHACNSFHAVIGYSHQTEAASGMQTKQQAQRRRATEKGGGQARKSRHNPLTNKLAIFVG